MAIPGVAQLDRLYEQIGYQMGKLGLLVLSLVAVGIIEFWFPEFFNYPYLRWELGLWNILAFWPLFLYGLVFAALYGIFVDHTLYEKEIFLASAATSILAGIWEEIGYRWLFICFAMILITFANFLFSTFAGMIIGGVAVVLGVILVATEDEKWIKASGAGLVILGIAIGIFGWDINPVFWFYREIIVPVVNFITFKQFDSIFYNGYPELFVFGMVLVNAWFRDGHKYQGLYGIINSWVVGFVLMCAMLNYGLLTAIVVHVIYDLQFDILRYCRTLDKTGHSYSNMIIWGRGSLISILAFVSFRRKWSFT